MKRLILWLILVAAAGCTRTEFTAEGGFKRSSFLQRIEFGEVTVRPDGSITLKGYRSDGGNEALAVAVTAAVTAAVESAKPIP